MRRAVLVIILAVLLVSCASPAYVPDEATLAEREAQEYATRVTRGAWAWRIFLTFAIIMLAILSGLVFFLAQVRYKVANYNAMKLRGDARRAHLVSLGEGYVLDMTDNTIYSRYNENTPPEVIPAPTAPPAPEYKPQATRGGLINFLTEAGLIAGWDSRTVPSDSRWQGSEYTISAESWMQHTNALQAMGLIEKVPNKGTMIAYNNDIAWLYHKVTSPTPSKDVGENGV